MNSIPENIEFDKAFYLERPSSDPLRQARRLVILRIEEYMRKRMTVAYFRNKLESISACLYSARSPQLTGMPSNHDPMAAQNQLIKLLDEKLELERMIRESQNSLEEDDLTFAIQYLSPQSRKYIKAFYLSKNPRTAYTQFVNFGGASRTKVYRQRDAALDELYALLYPKEVKM